jgi:NSS family neurotransmitter:Na+ symporter
MSSSGEHGGHHHLHVRERWGTRVGLVLAMAGNAIGLGNFLRFPTQAAQNGGGTFMVPYFISLILMGLPLMWVEWTIGRRGGVYGHGSTPGMFERLWNSRISKYLGMFGVLIPLGVALYYTYVESWTLGFAWSTMTGKLAAVSNEVTATAFLKSYQGITAEGVSSSIAPAYIFFLITFALNWYICHRGIVKGIELLAKIGIPTLFVLAVVLLVRVLTLGTPDPAQPTWNVSHGLGFIWVPDLARLGDASVWLAAAGQVFFTLSLGFGMIHTYASYVAKDSDITLNGLATASTNELAEVVFGGTIAIPAAVVFFGTASTLAIAKGGSFNLGFTAMPLIFNQMIAGRFFGTLWFGLLYLAGLTSSVAIIQPVIAFVQDEFRLTRRKSVAIVMIGLFILTQPFIFFLKHGFLDQFDYWIGTLALVVFALIEVVIFAWIFGMDRGWEELHRGADITVPKIFFYITKYVTPLLLIVILSWWIWQDGISQLLMRDIHTEGMPHLFAEADRPFIIGARVMIVALAAVIMAAIHFAWRQHRKHDRLPPHE